ncbi:MAG: hypothetical protein JWM68_5110 [Verrucomicrobiales bacterium]|nr:hypothetical protein [Verrucomicrobiales bacterium]
MPFEFSRVFVSRAVKRHKCRAPFPQRDRPGIPEIAFGNRYSSDGLSVRQVGMKRNTLKIFGREIEALRVMVQ